jgi:hypothetical protein
MMFERISCRLTDRRWAGDLLVVLSPSEDLSVSGRGATFQMRSILYSWSLSSRQLTIAQSNRALKRNTLESAAISQLSHQIQIEMKPHNCYFKKWHQLDPRVHF